MCSDAPGARGSSSPPPLPPPPRACARLVPPFGASPPLRLRRVRPPPLFSLYDAKFLAVPGLVLGRAETRRVSATVDERPARTPSRAATSILNPAGPRQLRRPRRGKALPPPSPKDRRVSVGRACDDLGARWRRGRKEGARRPARDELTSRLLCPLPRSSPFCPSLCPPSLSSCPFPPLPPRCRGGCPLARWPTRAMGAQVRAEGLPPLGPAGSNRARPPPPGTGTGGGEAAPGRRRQTAATVGQRGPPCLPCRHRRPWATSAI